MSEQPSRRSRVANLTSFDLTARFLRVPAARSRTTSVGVWAVGLAGIVILGLLPFLFGSDTVLTAGDALVLGLFAMSLNLLAGTTGLVSFGHGAYFGVGALGLALLVDRQGWPPMIALFVTPLIGGVAAFLSGFVVLRGREIYFGLLTLGVGQLFWAIAHGWVSLTGGDNGLTGFYNPDFIQTTNDFYWFTYVGVLVCVVLLWIITRSPFGDALRAIRENRRRAEFAGLWVKRYEMTALVVAGAFAGFAGGLFAILQNHASQEQMSWQSSADALIVSLIGGVGSFLGPVAGAMFYTFLGDYVEGHRSLIIGIVVLVVALVMPGGIAGTLRWLVSLVGVPVDRLRGIVATAPAVEAEHGETVHLPEAAAGAPALARPVAGEGAPVLVAAGLRKQFGGLVAVDDASFTVRTGTIHAIIGPNGAGKTTLFNLLTGLLAPDAGTITFDGSEVQGLAPWRLVRRGMGRSFQQANLFWALTSFDNVLLPDAAARDKTRRMWGTHAKSLRARARVRLGSVGLRDYSGTLASALSHGDQRSLELAAALAVDARLILLDEPTAGLSPAETKVAVGLIERIAREEGLTVLFIEHDMSVVFGVADWITVLHAGAVLADGPPAEIRNNPEVQRAYLGELDEFADGEHGGSPE